MVDRVRIFEASLSREGRVTIVPAKAGYYRDTAGGWMNKGLHCDFVTEAESVAEQLQDGMNWVAERNPGFTVQLVPAGGSIPGGTFWIVANAK